MPRSPGWRLLIGVFLTTLTVYLLAAAWILPFVEPPTGDSPHYLMQAISLIEDGDLDLRNNYTTAESYSQFSAPGRRRAGFRGIPVSYPVQPEGHIVVRSTPEGEVWYPKHGLGLPLLVVPGWLVGRELTPWLAWLTAHGSGGWPGTVVQMALIGALLAAQVFLLGWEVTGWRGIALTVWAAVSFSVPQLFVSLLLFPEIPAALATIYAFRHLAVRPLPTTLWRLLLIGLAIAVLPWLNPRFVLLSGGLVLIGAIRVWSDRRQLARSPQPSIAVPGHDLGARPSWPPGWDQPGRPGWLRSQRIPSIVSPKRLLQIGLLLGPLACSAAALRWYHLRFYGSALAVADQYEGFFVPTMVDERLGADWYALLVAAAGLLVDRQYGLLIVAPVYALAVVGLIALWRSPSYRLLVVALGLIALPYVALTADFRVWWGGWSPPARYLAVLAPLLAAPLARSLPVLAGSRSCLALFAVLAGLGWLTTLAMLAQLADPSLEQAVLSNPSRNPMLLRWLLLRVGLDLTPILPAIAPWFNDRRDPVPWLQIVGSLSALGLLVGAATRALRQTCGCSDSGTRSP
jgi:hypothetical protein